MVEKAWIEIVDDNEIVGVITGGYFCGARRTLQNRFRSKISKTF